MSKPLVHGELEDYLTGTTLPDTDDERYRQRLARFLVEDRGHHRGEITPRAPVPVPAGGEMTTGTVDFMVHALGDPAMMIFYGPGSLVSRHRPALALSRLLAGRPIPVVVVSNGEDADVLDGETGTVVGRGIEAIPTRQELEDLARTRAPTPLPPKRLELEARIASAFARLEDECNIEE